MKSKFRNLSVKWIILHARNFTAKKESWRLKITVVFVSRFLQNKKLHYKFIAKNVSYRKLRVIVFVFYTKLPITCSFAFVRNGIGLKKHDLVLIHNCEVEIKSLYANS